MKTIRSVRRSLATLTLAAAFVVPTGLIAAGCGGDSDSSGVAAVDDSASSTGTTGSTGTSTTVDSEQALLNFASCMRKEGVDFPDPQRDSEGNLRFQPGQLGDVDQSALQSAQEACQDELDGAQGALGLDQTELNDQFLEFARCMRENGVDVPDPEPGQAPGAGGAQIDQNDPDVQAALEACQSSLPNFGGGG
jgi:hypothetical protein